MATGLTAVTPWGLCGAITRCTHMNAQVERSDTLFRDFISGLWECKAMSRLQPATETVCVVSVDGTSVE